MKIKRLAALLLVLVFYLSSSAVSEDFSTAQEIVDKGFNYLRDKTSHGVVEMVIHRPDLYIKSADTAFIRITAFF